MALIGVTNCRKLEDYKQSVLHVGAEVRVLDPSTDIAGALEGLDGLLLTGGGDVSPQNTARRPIRARTGRAGPDDFELGLVVLARTRGVPILAICRGAQVLNVACGGTLVQDIPSQVPGALAHKLEVPPHQAFELAHEIWIDKDTLLSRLMRERLSDADACDVNSRHHQAVRQLAPGFIASATAPDGVIETIEDPAAVFCLGVQWHPENFFRTGEFRPLFEGLSKRPPRKRSDWLPPDGRWRGGMHEQNSDDRVGAPGGSRRRHSAGRPADAVVGESAQPDGAAFSAVPDAIGAEDVSGPYEVVAGLAERSEHASRARKWTYGGARGIFAESPNRVYLLSGGELPNIPRPQTRLFPEIGPNVQFPLAGLPWRNANTAAPPAAGGSGQDPAKGMELWRGASPPYRELGVDSRWEHCLVVVDAQGNIIEEWTQWDKHVQAPARRLHQPLRFAEARVGGRRPHARDLQVHERRQAARPDDRHAERSWRGRHPLQPADLHGVAARRELLRRPTAITARASRSSTRRASSCSISASAGEAGKETRPGYMNNVHGVAVDLETRRVFVNDRDNHRIQIFDENGKYLSEWKIAVSPSSLHFVQIGADRAAVTFDRNTHKMLKYDLDGRLLYAWGTVADFPGTLWGVHGMSTDQEGNLYVAEVDAGRFQKFRPRPGANPAYLIGKPVYSAWQ